MDRFGAGDEPETGTSFEAFFHAKYGGLVRFGYLLCGDPNEAEDMAQEAMARMFERWDRVRAMDSPGGYANRVMVNIHRRRFRRLRRAVTARGHQGQDPANDPMDDVATGSDVANALAALPEGQRVALLLVEWMGLDSTEAARILDVKPASVRSRVRRAKETLRPLLEVEDA